MPGAALHDLVRIEAGGPEGFGVGGCASRGRPPADGGLAPQGGAYERNRDRSPGERDDGLEGPSGRSGCAE